MAHEHRSNVAVCRCGEARIALEGAPIESLVCHCESCRTAGRGFERDQGAPPTVNRDGGIDYCLYRKDRVTIVHGQRHLREYRLKPASPTRRVVAGCCGSPMFLDFTPGHWLTIFSDRLAEQTAAPRMRVMTRDGPAGQELSNAIPAYAAHPPHLMIKLFAAWAAMGFRRPKIIW